MSVPNQKLVYIDREIIPKSNFIISSHDATISAHRRLTLNGIRVYDYFLMQIPDSYGGTPNEKNNREKPFELYTTNIRDKIGLDIKSIQRGINDLIKVGYLVPIKGSLYRFRDILPEDCPQTLDEHQMVLEYQVAYQQSLMDEKEERLEILKEAAKGQVEREQTHKSINDQNRYDD